MTRSARALLCGVALVLVGLVAFGTAGSRPALADHKHRLLAHASECPNQTDRSRARWRQERVMRCLHNYAREQRGLRRLRNQDSLWWAARRKAADILRCGEFSHTTCGRDVPYWLRRTSFLNGCYAFNENIAFGTGRRGSARRVMWGWLHSRQHRQALLTARHRKFGIGLARGNLRGPRAQVWVGYYGYQC